jgi:hypothetical protein
VLLIALVALAGAGAILIWGDSRARWAVAIGTLTAAALPLRRVKFVVDLIPNENARFFVLFALLAFPAFAFVLGQAAAFTIKDGKSAFAVDAQRLPASIGLRSTPKRPIVYAGRLGNRLAFYETLSGQMVLVSEDEVPTLAIREK